ncbi:MAG: sigma-70 family RNA polymerase sigma factor [Candidatus Syntrophosphaera sp.]|nr:sigma-70 family RNA polymerase sigma factor [Candidatus Syntrophosphaera sp.]
MNKPAGLPINGSCPESESLSLDQILSEHGKLAHGIANQYKNRGVPLEDLRQEALLGLIQAARRFQPDKGAQFSTYAVWWIKKQVLLALQKEAEAFHDIGTLAQEDLEAMPDPNPAPVRDSDLILPAGIPPLERQILILSCQDKLTLKEISQALQIPVERVKQLRGKALRRLKHTL